VTIPAVEGEVVRGRRVILREKRLSDAAQDYAWRSDPELARFDAANPFSASFGDYLSLLREELEYANPFRRSLSILDLEGRHIGNVMYYNIDLGRREAELGITIGDRSLWGQGYGSDAMEVFLRHLFERVGLRRVYLKTLDWNERARRCFERVGFVAHGAMRRGLHNFILMEARREWFQPAPEAAGERWVG